MHSRGVKFGSCGCFDLVSVYLGYHMRGTLGQQDIDCWSNRERDMHIEMYKEITLMHQLLVQSAALW